MAKLKPQERSLTITLLLFSHAFSLTHLLLLSLSHSLSLTHLFSPSLSHLFSPFHSFTELSLSLVPSLTRSLSHSFPLSLVPSLTRSLSPFPSFSLAHTRPSPLVLSHTRSPSPTTGSSPHIGSLSHIALVLCHTLSLLLITLIHSLSQNAALPLSTRISLPLTQHSLVLSLAHLLSLSPTLSLNMHAHHHSFLLWLPASLSRTCIFSLSVMRSLSHSSCPVNEIELWV